MFRLVFVLLLATAVFAGQARPRKDHFGFGRIVNGDEVQPHSIPYQVGLRMTIEGQENTSFCGGTLISRNYVLTAAHCADGVKEIEVVLGAHKINVDEPSQIRIKSEELIVHENWNWELVSSDVALVKLSTPAPLNENIKLVKLPRKSQANQAFADLPARVSGWGKTADTETTVSPVLRQVKLTTVSNDFCNEYYLGDIGERHICSSGVDSKGPCNGDSGGPLVLLDDNETQVGIASFVTDFGCEAGWPAGYSRVSKYLDWIEEHSDAVLED